MGVGVVDVDTAGVTAGVGVGAISSPTTLIRTSLLASVTICSGGVISLIAFSWSLPGQKIASCFGGSPLVDSTLGMALMIG